MRYCKKCLQPDTRPGIVFNEAGVCYACIYEKEKGSIDWDKREAELRNIVEKARLEAKQRGTYDCVVGVSGGKDSTFQAIYAKEKLGLNVLLVNCVPENITEVGKYNIENLVAKGFDMIQMRPNPKVMKELTKKSFFENGNPVKPSEYPLWASAFIIAEKFNIPLVIQGENAALTLGVKGNLDVSGDASNVINSNTLGGCNATDWVDDKLGVEELFMYQFPSKEKLIHKEIKSIYLQYYAKEWSQVGNADYAVARGMKGRYTEDLYDLGRYRRYTGLDTDIVPLNQMLKYYKFGFGFATDEACYDIREGRLTREDAIWLVNEYDGKCGEKYIEDFCKYIDIPLEEFWNVVDNLVNKKLFEKDRNTGKWTKRFKIGEDFIEK